MLHEMLNLKEDQDSTVQGKNEWKDEKMWRGDARPEGASLSSPKFGCVLNQLFPLALTDVASPFTNVVGKVCQK